MWLRYRDGTEADDKFFDLPEEEQIAKTAAMMGFSPSTPEAWPRDVVQNFIELRRAEGFYRFVDELAKYFSSRAA